MSVRVRLRVGAVLAAVLVSVVSLTLTRPALAAAGGEHSPPGVAAAPRPLAARAPLPAAGTVPTRHACTPAKQPGVASCDAIIRTDAAARQPHLAAGVAPLGYGPADLQSAYKLPSATAGRGTTVAIVDAYDDPNAEADLAVYRAKYGLPPCTTANGCFRKIDQRGGTVPPARDASWALEISLDLDMVSAGCPKCHILLVEADSAQTTDLGAAVNQAVAQGAKYVSNSYGVQDTGTLEAQWDAQYYDHPGLVITASAGDAGTTPGGQFPADSPHVVSVGGTSLMRDPSSPRGWSETAWGNADESSATGSGCAASFKKPSWQGTDTGCDASAGEDQRSYSDVSAVADPVTGVAIYDSYGISGWSVLGGTSASSPLIAAAYALAGRPAGGSYPAASLYASTGHASLNDITTGNNAFGDTTCGIICNAGPGWDGPTGWGTPIGVADFTAGPHGTVSGAVTDGNGKPVAGVQVTIGTATAVTDSAGRYATTVLAGTYTPAASLFGYASASAAPVTVTGGGGFTANFTLARLPLATVTGTVRDASGQGWPLYAEITVPGTPVVAYTDPATGSYTLTLPAGQPWTLHASAQFPGYQAADTPITPSATGLRQDIGLTADTTSCPAGYQTTYNGYQQNFDNDNGTFPVGWTHNSPGGEVTWQFNNPHQRVNHTGGEGNFALMDGINVVSGIHSRDGSYDSLFTPVIDLSTAKAPVLEFKQDLIFGGPDSTAKIKVSTDGGNIFNTVYSRWATQNPSVPGPDTEIIPLPQAAGHSQVQVEFMGIDIQENSLWELDDFFVGDLGCAPVSGGLVTGMVRDRNTGQPVDGVTVSGGGQSALTVPEPGDAAVGGGLYELFVPAGATTLTATGAGYSPRTAGVTVTSGTVSRADITLDAGRLSAAPASVAVPATIGGAARTATVQVTNTGSAPVTFHPVTQAGQAGAATQAATQAAAPAAPRAGASPGAGPPLRLVPGHYRPVPVIAGARQAAGARARVSAPAAPASAAAGGWVPPWTSAAHYPEYGDEFAAAADPATGKVYAAGGQSPFNYNDTTAAYMYDPARQAWSQLPDMPYSRASAVAAVIGGKFYVTGGTDFSDQPVLPYSGDVQAALSVYDPGTGRWSAGPPIPHPYWGSATAVLDGKMYVIGGCGFDTSGNSLCDTSDVQVFDPATRTWSAAAPYPLPIALGGCGAISGKLYCAGGFDHDLQRGTTAAYSYNPSANAWTAVASMPIDLWGGAGAAANGQLLMSGGVSRDDQVLTNQGYAYDPVTDSWSPLPNAPDATEYPGSACGFFSIGGYDGNHVTINGTTAAVAQLPGYGQCDGGAGVGWLSQSPAPVTLAPGQSATLTLTVTPSAAAVPQPGSYTATVFLDSAAPYPAPRVPVTLTAAPPASWGAVSGVISCRDCAGVKAPIAAATVQVNSKASGWTLTAGPDGSYRIWLPAADSPLSIFATASGGWLAGAATATLKAGTSVKANITLTQASCA